MDFSVKQTIGDLPIASVVKATGFPFSTIWRWWEQDRIPGRADNASHQVKRERLEQAVRTLKGKAPKAKRRKAA